jgi:hypothetical protein
MFELGGSEAVIVILAFVAAFAAIMAVILPFIRRDPLDARMAIVAARRQELSRD